MSFDPTIFEETVIENANEENYTPVPEGDYEGYIEDFRFKHPREDVTFLDVTWVIPDEKLAKDLSTEQVTVRQSIFLELTSDGKSLAFGSNKNVQLGRFRKSLGMNEKGKAFQWGALRGVTAKLAVTQRPDEEDPSKIYNDVKVIPQAA